MDLSREEKELKFSMFVPSKPEDRPKWARGVLRTLGHRRVSQNVSDIERDNLNIKTYMSKTDVSKYAFMTHEYGEPFPAHFTNYSIVKPKIDTLVNELLQRGIRPVVTTTNADAIDEKFALKAQLEWTKLMRPILEEQKSRGVDHLIMDVPEDTDEYIATYKEAHEKFVQDAIDYLINDQHLMDIAQRDFLKACLTGKQCIKIESMHGDPWIRFIDARNLIYDRDSIDPYHRDGQFAGEDTWLSIDEILQIYGDDLSNADLTLLTKISSAYKRGNSGMGYSGWSGFGLEDSFCEHRNGQGLRLRVLHMEWKAIANIHYEERKNSEGAEITWVFDDDDLQKATDEKISSFKRNEYTEIWEGVNIANIIYVRMRPRPNQPRNDKDYGAAKLSYRIAFHNYFNGETVSLVDLLYPIQETINIIVWHIMRLLQNAAGRAVVYDTSQLPKDYDLSRVLYHMKADNVILINSAQEGNQFGRQTFNQFQQIDFTLSASIQQYINLFTMFDELGNMVSGINSARMGQSQMEGLQLNQEQIRRSMGVTELYFFVHYMHWSFIFEDMVELAKILWKDGKRAAYTMGGRTNYIMLTGLMLDKFQTSTYGISINSPGSMQQRLQTLNQAAAAAMQTGNINIAEYLDVISGDNLNDIKMKLQKKVSEKMKAQIQNQQQSMEYEQRMKEFEMQVQQHGMQMQESEIQKDLKIAEMNNQTKMAIAELTSQISSMINESNKAHQVNMEQMKADLEQQKSRMEFLNKNVMAPMVNQEMNKMQGGQLPLQ